MKQKPRNPIARAAILSKGGVHEKSNKAKRQKDKQVLKKKLRADQFGSFCFDLVSYFSSQQHIENDQLFYGQTTCH